PKPGHPDGPSGPPARRTVREPDGGGGRRGQGGGAQAVQTVLTEVLTNPVVLAKFRDALPPPTPVPLPVATPVHREGLKDCLAKVWSWLGGKVRSVLGACQVGLNWLG